MNIATFADAKKALEAFMPMYVSRGKIYSLEYVVALLEYLGNPQDAYNVIHVAGTSGKTSTAYYASALLREAGYKVGLTVSPHTVEINDRVQIQGQPMEEPLFCSELGLFLDIVKKSGIQPTYFEIMVAFAFWEFARQGVKAAVVEVGLGGMLDATNTIHRPGKICVITDIGLDHTKILGNTIPEIAAQKAGIIQLHNDIFMYRQSDEIMGAVEQRAKAKKANLHAITERDVSAPRWLPKFQQRNFGLACIAAQTLAARDGNVIDHRVVDAAAQISIPGRMEQFSYKGKTIILDGAHNGQKIAALVESLRGTPGLTDVAFLIGFIDTHEAQNRIPDALHSIAAIADDIAATQFGDEKDYPRSSVSAQSIIEAAHTAHIRNIRAIEDPVKAMDELLSNHQTVVVAGSLYLLNHIRPYVTQIAQPK